LSPTQKEVRAMPFTEYPVPYVQLDVTNVDPQWDRLRVELENSQVIYLALDQRMNALVVDKLLSDPEALEDTYRIFHNRQKDCKIGTTKRRWLFFTTTEWRQATNYSLDEVRQVVVTSVNLSVDSLLYWPLVRGLPMSAMSRDPISGGSNYKIADRSPIRTIESVTLSAIPA
jgi:hypothetical protein